VTAPRESRIILVRHGRTADLDVGGWLDSHGMRRRREAEDLAGIVESDKPPQWLLDRAAEADLIVSSDLPRAVASAERLAPDRPIVQSPLLIEAPLDIPNWLPLRWPVRLWESVMLAQWGVRILRGSDTRPEDAKRANTAARWLTRLSDESPLIIAITHGVFRRMLAERLITGGWKAQNTKRSYDNWSAWELVNASHKKSSSR
jgi:broad specificity phosphatase PhoE